MGKLLFDVRGIFLLDDGWFGTVCNKSAYEAKSAPVNPAQQQQKLAADAALVRDPWVADEDANHQQFCVPSFAPYICMFHQICTGANLCVCVSLTPLTRQQHVQPTYVILPAHANSKILRAVVKLLKQNKQMGPRMFLQSGLSSIA